MTKRINFITLLVSLLLLTANRSEAQAASVVFDYPNTASPAVVQGYIATLYVNGTAFVLNDTCVLTTVAPIVVRCTATLPDITSALTASGNQNFEISLKDVILEGAKSAPPFVLTRPSAPQGLRIQ